MTHRQEVPAEGRRPPPESMRGRIGLGGAVFGCSLSSLRHFTMWSTRRPSRRRRRSSAVPPRCCRVHLRWSTTRSCCTRPPSRPTYAQQPEGGRGDDGDLRRAQHPGRLWPLSTASARTHDDVPDDPVTYAFPGVLLLIPLYGMMSSLKLVDTAARADHRRRDAGRPVCRVDAPGVLPDDPAGTGGSGGAGRGEPLEILTRMILPLAAPGVASVAIFAFITSWTEYIFASVLILSEANRTVPVGLAGIIGQYQVDWGLLLAGATATALPVLVLFRPRGAQFRRGPDRRCRQVTLSGGPSSRKAPSVGRPLPQVGSFRS